MRKTEYLDALKRAMTGLPPETQARTLAFYEQRFVDGVAAGGTEEEIFGELDDPKKIAMTLRTSAHLETFKETKSPASLLRLFVSALALAIFNLFMVVPAAVCASLLMALYICSLTFYLAGIAITASGLAGANEIVLNEPLTHVSRGAAGATPPVKARVVIGPGGIHVNSARSSAEASASGDDKSRVTLGSENMSAGRILISTEMDEESRATQTIAGLGMVLGGIVMFLLSLVATRYTFIGIKRYVQMNLSLLKGS